MSGQSAGALEASIEQAVATLRNARRVCVLTGAGVSAESGIPTFRDALTGLWEKFSPEDLATPEAFERDPKFVWDWYEFRREMIRKSEPNPGHYALVELARLVPGFTLVTQNVDGLHQRAGSRGVLEYHGNILRDRCTVEQIIADRSEDSRRGMPRCAACGGLLRPDVVWFGEAIPAGPMMAAAEAARDCDVFLSIGTSSLVYPAAGLAEAALAAGARVVEINPGRTELSNAATVVLDGPSGIVLPRLVAGLR